MLSQFEHRDVRGRKTMCKSTWGDGHLKPRKDLQQLFPSWLSSCHTLISYFHGAQYCQEISVVQIAQLTVLYFTNSSKINQFPLLLLIYSEHGKGLKINITKIPSFSLFVYNSKNKLILIPPVHMESIKFFSSSFHLRLQLCLLEFCLLHRKNADAHQIAAIPSKRKSRQELHNRPC